MPHVYSKKELEKARKFAERFPRYHAFLKRHPWLPGLYMILAGIGVSLMWYFEIGKGAPLFIVLWYILLPIVGLFSLGWGILQIIRYIRNPEAMHKEFSDWETSVFNKKSSQ